MKKSGEMKMKKPSASVPNKTPVKYIAIIALLILAIIGAVINGNLTIKSEREKLLVAMGKFELEWHNKTKVLLSEQHDKFVKEAQLDRLKEKDAFQTALTKAISELQPKLDRKTADRISFNIISECLDNNLDPILVTALIWVESRFDCLAHSNKGAIGLMQVRYSTWKEDPIIKDNGVSAKYKLYWIDLNIKCGTDILAKYYKEADQDVIRALYRYNTGNKDLPDKVGDFEVEYVNKIVITAYKISDSIRKGNNDLPNDH
jgi:hypothetical protein